jgi:hypothetical protein
MCVICVVCIIVVPLPQDNNPFAVIIKKTPWSDSASEWYRPSDRRLSAKWLPTFADKGCNVVSVTDPCGSILAFLDRNYCKKHARNMFSINLLIQIKSWWRRLMTHRNGIHLRNFLGLVSGLRLLNSIQEVLGSNLDRNTGHPDWGSSWFLQDKVTTACRVVFVPDVAASSGVHIPGRLHILIGRNRMEVRRSRGPIHWARFVLYKPLRMRRHFPLTAIGAPLLADAIINVGDENLMSLLALL